MTGDELWTEDWDKFRQDYFDLYRSFNPLRFDAKEWAREAQKDGFGYVMFTTKHHDGFCLYDSAYSDYKVTNPRCPYSQSDQPYIVKALFDALRERQLGVVVYFSKSDWHNDDYWENCGIGHYTSRNTTYDTEEKPEKWARFREFAHNQVMELATGYGPVDVFGFDAHQVFAGSKQDVHMKQLHEKIHQIDPNVICIDRQTWDICETIKTLEDCVPAKHLDIPFECVFALGQSYAYLFDDEYSPLRPVLYVAIDVIATGGNFLIDLAPSRMADSPPVG